MMDDDDVTDEEGINEPRAATGLNSFLIAKIALKREPLLRYPRFQRYGSSDQFSVGVFYDMQQLHLYHSPLKI